MTKTKQVSYQALSDQLDTIVAAMQSGDGDVDQIAEQYEQGMKLIAELEIRLQTVQATVTELKAKHETTTE